MRFKQNGCNAYALLPVKERSNAQSRNSVTIYLSNFFIKSQHTESFSGIELFFNGMSLVYLWTGVSFNFLRRKMNKLIRGTTYRLVSSFSLVLLQIFMIWQIEGIIQIYQDNSRMPSLFTITGVELIPPALSICFHTGKINLLNVGFGLNF